MSKEQAMSFEKRPSGSIPRMVGSIAIGFGLLFTFFGMILPPTVGSIDYGTIRSNDTKWLLLWGGIAVTNLGFILWVTGYLVTALYHLPGRDVPAE